MTGKRALLVVAATLALAGCRCGSSLGEDHASLSGAASMAKSFWVDVLAGDYDSAERHFASDAEIEAALQGWSRVMNEPIDEASLAREVQQTRERLDARWKEMRSGRDPIPDGIGAAEIERADTVVGNKLFIGPHVSYIQRLSLTGPGVDPARARVAGAVRVGDGEWKILWLP